MPERAEFALRLALICTLTTLATEIYRAPSAALTAYVVFFLNRPDRTSSLLLNVIMTVLITIVVGFILLIARTVVDQPGLRLAVMTLISLSMLFLASASKLKPIAGILAMVVAYSLDLLGAIPLGEAATRGALYAWLFVATPAAISVVVNLLIAPAPRKLAERALARRLRAAAAMLRGPTQEERGAFAGLLDEGVAEILGRLRLAGLERTSPPVDIVRLTEAAYSTGALLFVVDALADAEGAPEAWRREAAATLIEMAEAFESGGYPVRITIESVRAGPIAELTAEFARTLERFTDPPSEALPQPQKAKGGFFLPDAFTNPVHVQYALKTTAAAMICYLFYSLADWPGIHTCLITCYIVALGTAAETVEKLTLRILGCLVGAAAGVAAIVWLMPALTTIGGLLVVVFLGALAAAWVAAGAPRISYAGFQIAFAFFLCVIQGSAPAFDLVVARDRVIGILIGNLVVYAIFTRLWPVSVTARVDTAMAELLRGLGRLARLAAPGPRRRLLPELATTAGGLRSDLLVARYEPAGLRPGSDWAARRGRALEAIQGLEGPLLLSRPDDALADRLDRIAARIGAAQGPAAAETESPAPQAERRSARAPANPARRRLDEGLEELEQALG